LAGLTKQVADGGVMEFTMSKYASKEDLYEAKANHYESVAESLLDAAYTALPYVEDALLDDGYKYSSVERAVNLIKAAIKKAEATA
jgi:hypothetical protein